MEIIPRITFVIESSVDAATKSSCSYGIINLSIIGISANLLRTQAANFEILLSFELEQIRATNLWMHLSLSPFFDLINSIRSQELNL